MIFFYIPVIQLIAANQDIFSSSSFTTASGVNLLIIQLFMKPDADMIFEAAIIRIQTRTKKD